MLTTSIKKFILHLNVMITSKRFDDDFFCWNGNKLEYQYFVYYVTSQAAAFLRAP